jgi:hypothetical protein
MAGSRHLRAALVAVLLFAGAARAEGPTHNNGTQDPLAPSALPFPEEEVGAAELGESLEVGPLERVEDTGPSPALRALMARSVRGASTEAASPTA